VAEVLALALSGWRRSDPAVAAARSTGPGAAALEQAANWVVLDSALRLLDSDKLHPQVDAEVRQAVRALAAWLARSPGQGSVADNRRQAAGLITRYLADPRSVKLRPAPPIPPGAPI
jgi:hypothetical protein